MNSIQTDRRLSMEVAAAWLNRFLFVGGGILILVCWPALMVGSFYLIDHVFWDLHAYMWTKKQQAVVLLVPILLSTPPILWTHMIPNSGKIKFIFEAVAIVSVGIYAGIFVWRWAELFLFSCVLVEQVA